MEGNFRVGQWLIEPQLNSISAAGETVRLEPKVMQVLICLADRAGNVVTKEKLIRSVWADFDLLTRKEKVLCNLGNVNTLPLCVAVSPDFQRVL